MSAVSYIAQRSLTGGALAGDPVDIDITLQQLDRSGGWKGKSNLSRDGSEERVVDRYEARWRITTLPKKTAEFSAIRQFADSVLDGQEFTFDPYGTIAAPVDPRTVVCETTSYSEARVQVDYLSVSLVLREV